MKLNDIEISGEIFSDDEAPRLRFLHLFARNSSASVNVDFTGVRPRLSLTVDHLADLFDLIRLRLLHGSFPQPMGNSCGELSCLRTPRKSRADISARCSCPLMTWTTHLPSASQRSAAR